MVDNFVKNVILPQENFDMRRFSDEFYVNIGSTRSNVFDTRDDFDKFKNVNESSVRILKKIVTEPSCRTHLAIGFLDHAIHYNQMIYDQDYRMVLGVATKNISLGYPRHDNQEGRHQLHGMDFDPDMMCEMHFPGKSIVINMPHTQNFHHFIADHLHLFELLSGLIDEGYERIIVTDKDYKTSPFKTELIEILYPHLKEKMVFVQKGFKTDHSAFAIWRPDAYIFDKAAGLYHSKALPPDMPQYVRSFVPFSLINLFDRVEKTIGKIPFEKRNDIVVLSRKDDAVRSIVNEDDLINALQPYGPKVVRMGEYPVLQQMQISVKARILIGCHGPELVNAGFMQKNAKVIEYITRHHVKHEASLRKLSFIRDIDYDFIYCDEAGNSSGLIKNRGTHIRLSQAAIEKTVELCKAALARSDDFGGNTNNSGNYCEMM